MSIEAMKQALEALEQIKPLYSRHDAKAILRQAISEAEKQEPVAWMVYTLDGKSVCVTDNHADFTEKHRALPLYTRPPEREWVGLTDEEIEEVERWVEFKEEGSGRIPMIKLVKCVETKLKEKNT